MLNGANPQTLINQGPQQNGAPKPPPPPPPAPPRAPGVQNQAPRGPIAPLSAAQKATLEAQLQTVAQLYKDYKKASDRQQKNFNVAEKEKAAQAVIQAALTLQEVQLLALNEEKLHAYQQTQDAKAKKAIATELKKTRQLLSNIASIYTGRIAAENEKKHQAEENFKAFADAQEMLIETNKKEIERLDRLEADFNRQIARLSLVNVPGTAERIQRFHEDLAKIPAYKLAKEQENQALRQKIADEKTVNDAKIAVFNRDARRLTSERAPLIKLKDAVKPPQEPKSAQQQANGIPRPPINLADWVKHGVLGPAAIDSLRKFITLKDNTGANWTDEEVLRLYQGLTKNQIVNGQEVPNTAQLNEFHILGITSGYLTRANGVFCRTHQDILRDAMTDNTFKPWLEYELNQFYANPNFQAFQAFANQGILPQGAAGAGNGGGAALGNVVAQQLQQAVSHANQGQRNAPVAAPNGQANPAAPQAAPMSQAQQIQALDAAIAQKQQQALHNHVAAAPLNFVAPQAAVGQGAVGPQAAAGQGGGVPNGGIPGGVDPALLAQAQQQLQQLTVDNQDLNARLAQAVAQLQLAQVMAANLPPKPPKPLESSLLKGDINKFCVKFTQKHGRSPTSIEASNLLKQAGLRGRRLMELEVLITSKLR